MLHSNQKTLAFLPLPPDDYTLKPKRIDIWQYSLTTLDDQAESLLNDQEYLRAKRYHFPRHQRRFTIARAQLRRILARYLNTQPKNLEFSENAYGKPSIAGESRIHFNLSHSKDLALLAIGQDYPLGIDLEHYASRELTGIAHLMFSPKEIKAFDQMPATLRSLSFFHIWAQKEAFIKACGMGLSYPTQQFDVPPLPPTQQTIVDNLHQQTWQMRSFMPQLGCAAALCHHPEITILRYHRESHAFTG